ncbi:flagellin N-terminal helical domain-containing protein [Andreprevotia chitinilytica]|uniref:flagellin N-terminal helical domain-containing protein n=1 Tax=Andreprevotia chitinilytica TaxID=396808 RepID=UPI00054D6B65|nr:flagellin [Andreprevotia chitinilytica]
MSLSINTNTPSLFGQNQLNKTQKDRETTLAQLSSGNRLTSAAVDAAGVAIAAALSSQITGSDQGIRNLNDGVSLAQTADGALNQIQSNTQDIRTLAVAAGNGTLNASDRAAIQAQADALSQSNQDIVKNAQFNGQPLLQGGAAQTFQAGPNANETISVGPSNLQASPANGGLYSTSSVDLSSPAAASTSLGNLDTDLTTVTGLRGTYGATISRFSAAASNLATSSTNLSAARSRIADTDYAAATSQNILQQIRSQAGLASLTQANSNPQLALSLLK